MGVSRCMQQPTKLMNRRKKKSVHLVVLACSMECDSLVTYGQPRVGLAVFHDCVTVSLNMACGLKL